MNKLADNQEENEKKRVFPRLRFQEFRKAEGWEMKPLSRVALFFKGKGLPKSEVLLNGKNLCIHYGQLFTDYSEVIYSVKNRTDLESDCFFSVENDVLMPTSDVTPKGLAKACCIKVNGVILGGDILIIRSDKAVANGEFLSRSIRNYESQVLQLVSGTTVFHLYASSMQKMPLVFPDIREQQKIANCLSSLDDLIETEAKKLEELKEHKTSLMQKLFPAEGETVPRFRFREFREESEWKAKLLEEVCNFVRGPFGGALKKEIFVQNGYAVYEQMHAIYQNFDSFRYYINEKKFNELKRFSVLPNDLVMSCSGTMGKFAIIPPNAKKGVINQALLKLSMKKGYYLNFIKLTLEFPSNQHQILSQAGGGAIKNVASVAQIKEIRLSIPGEKEQQKIADCLSSLDDLITAQTKKIETLKTHKKGLMQQLFPVMNDEVKNE